MIDNKDIEEFTAEGKEDQVEMRTTASSLSLDRVSKDSQAVVAEIRAPKRRQLVHNARQMFETRWAKYNDPRNEEWDFDDITDKWERHAWSAYRDLVEVEKERDTLLQIIDSLPMTLCPSEGLLRGQAASMIFDVFGNADLYAPPVGRNLVALQQRITEALQIAHRSALPITQDSASASELAEQLPDASSCPHLHQGLLGIGLNKCIDCGASLPESLRPEAEELVRMLRLRREQDPDAPDMIVLATPTPVHEGDEQLKPEYCVGGYGWDDAHIIDGQGNKVIVVYRNPATNESPVTLANKIVAALNTRVTTPVVTPALDIEAVARELVQRWDDDGDPLDVEDTASLAALIAAALTAEREARTVVDTPPPQIQHTIAAAIAIAKRAEANGRLASDDLEAARDRLITPVVEENQK